MPTMRLYGVLGYPNEPSDFLIIFPFPKKQNISRSRGVNMA